MYADNAAKLAPLGSFQRNESFHNTIASKAPKFRHYGSSESNDVRVAAAVCEQNLGHQYVVSVVQSGALSPSENAAAHSKRLQKKRKRAAEKKSEPAFKRRCLELRSARSAQQKAQEAREGTE